MFSIKKMDVQFVILMMLAIILSFILAGASSAQTVMPAKTIAVGQTTTTLTMTWAVPLKHTDGTPITGTLTYNTYWGTSCTVPLSNKMNPLPLSTAAYVVTNVGPGLKCFAATAIENGGIETPQGPETSIMILAAPVVAPAPNPPTNVTVK